MSCNESKVYLGDIGTKIKLYSGQDIQAATVTKIKYKKPDNSVGEWVAQIEDDCYLSYITTSGDLDQTGEWQLQLYVEMPGWTGRGETIALIVYGDFL